MSDARATAYQSKVDELKLRFGVRLRGNIEDLGLLITELDAGADRAACRERIRQLAHSLAGVAGTFGFSDISDAGAGLENAVLDQASDDAVRILMQSTIDTISAEIPVL